MLLGVAVGSGSGSVVSLWVEVLLLLSLVFFLLPVFSLLLFFLLHVVAGSVGAGGSAVCMIGRW